MGQNILCGISFEGVHLLLCVSKLILYIYFFKMKSVKKKSLKIRLYCLLKKYRLKYLLVHVFVEKSQ